MSKLNVRLPDRIIRVSEQIPQIILYIQQIISNGFAYESLGSVYFDSNAYAKEGYDEVQLDLETIPGKKSPKDFALWKGRESHLVGFDAEFEFGLMKKSMFGVPGWHIECSTIIHNSLGTSIDIHFGGIDLKFPHHQNEIIQANAFYHPMYKNKKWCEKFVHIGHLCISGLKMSKSLKNFTTINSALETNTPNQVAFFLT